MHLYLAIAYNCSYSNYPNKYNKDASFFIDLATVCPEPADYECYIKAQLYNTNYTSSIPCVYSWPK
jgi:hypothetical protein